MLFIISLFMPARTMKPQGSSMRQRRLVACLALGDSFSDGRLVSWNSGTHLSRGLTYSLLVIGGLVSRTHGAKHCSADTYTRELTEGFLFLA